MKNTDWRWEIEIRMTIAHRETEYVGALKV
jgi:hypothetical protein